MKELVEKELAEIRGQRDEQLRIYNEATVNIHRLNGAEAVLLNLIAAIPEEAPKLAKARKRAARD